MGTEVRARRLFAPLFVASRRPIRAVDAKVPHGFRDLSSVCVGHWTSLDRTPAGCSRKVAGWAFWRRCKWWTS